MAIDSSYGWRIPVVEITKGDRLQAARREAGISGERMAELLGVNRRTITRWESSESAPPAVVIAYAVSTETNLGWLQTGVPSLPPNVTPLGGKTDTVTDRYPKRPPVRPLMLAGAA